MKGRLVAIIVFLLFIFVFTSGLFEGIVNFLTWLVTLNMTQSNISIAGEILLKQQRGLFPLCGGYNIWCAWVV